MFSYYFCYETRLLYTVIMFARQIVRAAARNARIVTRAPVAARSFSFTPLRFGAGSSG